MKSYTLNSYKSDGPCVCALGCFDGVHIGHASLIAEAKRIAQSLAIPTMVWSFREPPKSFFTKDGVPILTSPAEKRLQINKLRADIYLSVAFDEKIASVSPEDFFDEIIIKKIKAAHIVCGFNYRFGKGGKGDTQMLARLCKERGIGLSVIPPVTIDGITVSSSEIRSALEDGDTKKACVLLGRPYSLRARVIDGQHLGRRLGFPTINQCFPKGKLVPKNGVYLTKINIGRKKYYGITNAGVRPTIDGRGLFAETNIFGFNGDLYGRTVTVEFLEFLRSEKKFSSVEQLTAQVLADIEKAKSIIEK